MSDFTYYPKREDGLTKSNCYLMREADPVSDLRDLMVKAVELLPSLVVVSRIMPPFSLFSHFLHS
jgi:hypothetical protein